MRHRSISSGACRRPVARIVAFDPEGMEEAGRLLKDVTFTRTAYEAATGADVLLVITEWHEFVGLTRGASRS